MKHILKASGATLLVLSSLFFVANHSPISAATYEFEPATLNVPAVCQKEISVIVDTGSDHSNAADIDIHFNPAEITVLDSMPTITGTQVKPGDAYDSYVYNLVDNSSGLIRVAAGALLSDLTGRKTFITIKFQSKPGVISSNFDIYFTGANHTLDSNIADTVTNLDLLTGVVNGTVTFNNLPCNPDIIPPVIKINSPTTDLFTGPLIIETELSDAQSGVNVATFLVIIDGVEYTPTDPVITYSGNMFKYTLTIQPNQFINGSSTNQIIFTVRDHAGNIGSNILILNSRRPNDTPIPTTVTPTPTPTTTPVVTTLPETGVTPTPCPVFTDNSLCQILLEQETEKAKSFNINSVNSFTLSLGKLNNLIPGMGLLALMSLILNVQALFGIFFFIVVLKRWSKRLNKYCGVIYDKNSGNEIYNAKVILYDQTGKKIDETKPDYHGRYYFDVPNGNYKVEIMNGNYEKIETTLNITEDGKITYHQLAYKDKVSKFKEWRDNMNRIFIKDSLVFAILAYLLSLLAVILAPGLITIIIFIFNLVVLILAIILKVIAASKLGI